MGSRLRNDVKHLIECFCEIVSPETSNKQPWVVQKFPENFKDDEMLKQVSLFAFPCDVPCNTVQHFSFVLTSLDSKWTFGFCRQAPGAQTALVIISYLPWHEFFFKILNQIAELMQEQAVQDLNSFLEGLYQRDVPAPSTTLHIPFGRAHRVYTCKCPNTYTLPSIPENRNLTEYFNAVDAHNMMVIFASMLHERRIVMVSSRISRLSACIQAANAVIYPMIWQHIYIPVLPPHLMDYLLAPMPYLSGVPSTTWERVRKSELGELVVLNVDSNHIETPFDDLERLPPDIVSGMRRRLKTPGNMMGDGVARVFLRALVQLIGGYRDALRFRQGEQITFCEDALVQSRPLPLRPFLESMLQLQIFQQFIEERLEMLNSGQGFSDEFELEACLYSDKSSSRLKQQYKEWSSTMRKESGALFKKANPAMRNAVKTVGRLAKEKSRTAYREVRSKFKDMQINRELEGAAYSAANTKLRDKPRSAPSSPKFSSSDVSANQRRTVVSPSTLTHQINSNFIDRNHSLRRCETSVSQHYHVSGSSPGYPTGTNGASSSSDESGTEDELNMIPLNLNLMDDMKDILAKTASSASTPPAIDRSRKPSLSSPPVSPVANPVLRQHSAPILNAGPYSVQPIPLPPLRSRKRTEPQSSPLSPKSAAQVDLIRLDSATSLSPVDEFDPLGALRTEPEPTRVTQSNPVYSFHVPRQIAEPQVPSGASSGSGGSTTFKGYTSRFDTGSDPFSNLLAFTRTNLGPTVSGPERAKPNESFLTSDKSSWTTFDCLRTHDEKSLVYKFYSRSRQAQTSPVLPQYLPILFSYPARSFSMAAVSLLSLVLSEDEFKNLNDSIKIKLEEVLKKHENDSNHLNIKFAKLQTQSEQQCFELDSQLQQLQDRSRREESLIQELTDGKAKVEADLASSQDQLNHVGSKLALLEATHQEWKKEKESLSEEKDNLNSLLSRRNDDLDRLTGELKALTDQLVHANKEKSEALIKTEELNSQQLALDYKEKRLNQERELIVRQQRLLQDELESRTKEVMNIRREKTSKVLELQADLSEKIEELRIAQKSIGELTTTIERHEKHTKELNDKLKELSETEMKMSENNRNELRSQMRLCDLYKASSEDAQAKADEITKTTEELQRLLRDASVRFGNLETDSKAQIDQLNDQLQKSSETNGELKKELERANALLDPNKSRLITEENIEAMSPSAAAASRLLKSGMTLTQIYSQYVSISEQMLFKEEENKKLNNYIDQILQELEDRAPTIARQREDYEKSIEMVANLTRQLDLAVEEAETERENALEARRMLGQSQRTSQRLEKQVADLSKQVCLLIRETEELRGNRIRDEPADEDQVTSSEGSAAAVISRHLVTFRDVEELQQKNQMLLTTLREVTEKQDAAEQSEIDTKTAKIQRALENALTEVEHLRDTRRRHEELMESVIQQRDMYRILLQEAGLGDAQTPSKFRSVVTSTPAQVRQESARPADIELQLNESKKCVEEKETKLQSILKEKKEREAALDHQIQALQGQLAELRAQNVRLSTHNEYSDSKEKLLQGNLDSCKKQLNALEDKNKVYATTIAKHEQSIAVLRDEAMNAQQLLARAEVNVSMLQEEKQLLKDAEQRLLVERNALVSERRSQGLLHANLESIKLNLERGECETRMRLQNNVTALEQQIELLRKKLDLEEQRYRETVKSFEDKLASDQVLLKAAEEKAANAEAQLVVTRERLTLAESRTGLTSPTRKGQVTRLLSTTPTSVAAANDSDLVGDLRAQLAEARTESSKHREQLELVRQQAEQYRSIADSMEEQLNKSNEASQTFKQETEQHLVKLNEDRSELARNLQEAQNKLKTLEEGAAILGQATAHQSEEVSNRITALEAELASMAEKFKLAEDSEAKAREEALDQVKNAKEAQEKYERELMQHAADVEQLNSVRDQFEQTLSQLAVLQQTSARIETELASGRISWETQKEMLEKEASEKARRCSDLDKQVDLMQQQIVTLSTRMAAATRCQEIAVRTQSGDDSNTSLNVSISEEDMRSTDQLLELVRFLRREKEIAISRSEVQEAETQRLKTQLEQAERLASEAQTNLHHERERSATSALTSEKHTEMLRRLETLNALTDSNRLLRDERSGLISRLEELTVKVSALETELEPLRSTNQESASKLDELTSENNTLRKQVMVWRTRTNALQERAGRATADEIKKLQTDKELVQKQLEQIQKQVEHMKEIQAKTATQLTETQRINTQLITTQHKLQEEARVAKEESQKAQTDMTTAIAKRDEETAKAADQANQLRRIARKYKTQYEELKVEHEKLVGDKETLASAAADSAMATATAVQDEAANAATAEASAATAVAQSTRIQELEEQIAQMTAELEQIKQENQAMRSKDEKATNVLKTTRQKLASLPNLIKEKEALVSQLTEARDKIENLEQGSEELNVRTAALRSQLEGRLNRLERENSELGAAKQALESELETLQQRIPVLQRQVEAYQKQLVLVQQKQQKQQIQQAPQQTSNKPPSADKTISENPPTANIKPMASGATVTPQRPPVSSSPGQSTSGPNQIHRTTPTASIRPMAMTTRTLAVQPTSVSVSPMAPPLIAIAAPTPVAPSTPSPVVREDEPVAGPSFVSGGDQTQSTSGADDRSKKRTRVTEESPSTDDASAKRTRLSEQTEEEVEVVDLHDEPTEESTEEYTARTGEMDLVIEYEEQPQDDHEVEEEEVEEGLIESEEEEMVETVESEEGEQEDECDEIVVEEQRDDVEEQTQSGQDSEAVLTINEDESASGTVEQSTETEEIVIVVQEEQQPAAEDVEPETFAPASTNEAAPSSEVSQATIRPPPREDRLPSFGRNTLAFEDVGDDGIVPSTPVLLRPRTNDGFAEAVSSPQVNTRFVFGTVPDLSLSTGSSHINAPSHLESQGMEDTRMDLSQLDENSGRSVPSTPLQASPHDELPTGCPGEDASVVPSGNAEEQGDFEGGPDLEGDAAAEIDLLGEDDQDTGIDNDQSTSQLGQDAGPTSTTEDESMPEVQNAQSVEGPGQSMTTQPSSAPSFSCSPTTRAAMTRRGSMAGFPRGRGMSREDSRMSAGPNPSRPVPITWTPNPESQQAYTPNPARVFRRATAVVASPAPGTPSVTTEPPVVVPTAAPVPSLIRGRGATRGRPRPRAPRRM